jgi:predicted nucleotidyltransferase
MATPTPPADLAEYVTGARARQAARRRQLEERRTDAIAVARRAAEVLRAQFGATQVALFGSTLRPGAFHERSDVDLAAWGLSGPDYWRALAVLEDLDPTLVIELVRAEAARPSLLAEIEEAGLAL